YPGRHWLGLGSGEALNEHIVAGYWPETPERIARMFEAIEIIKRLFGSPDTAKKTGQYADGLITVGAPESKLEMIRAKCEEGCRDAGKDPNDFKYILQLHLSWAPTDEAAMATAMLEWPNGGM